MNLNGTQPFNALLRAMVQVQSATAAPGARYLVELAVDGQPWGLYLRRLREKVPQFELFTATATNLAAGGHSFTVLAGLLDLSGQPFLQRVLIEDWDRLGGPFQQFAAANPRDVEQVFNQSRRVLTMSNDPPTLRNR